MEFFRVMVVQQTICRMAAIVIVAVAGASILDLHAERRDARRARASSPGDHGRRLAPNNKRSSADAPTALARTWAGASSGPVDDSGDEPAARVAYVVHASPYGRTDRSDGGHVSSHRMLAVHMEALAQLPTRLAAVLVVLSTDATRRELPGYADGLDDWSTTLRCPVRTLRVANNSLGSYGM